MTARRRDAALERELRHLKDELCALRAAIADAAPCDQDAFQTDACTTTAALCETAIGAAAKYIPVPAALNDAAFNKISALERELFAAKDAANVLSRRLKVAEAKAAGYCTTAAAAEREAASLRAQVTTVLGSRSWAWTALLRACGKYLSRKLLFRTLRRKIEAHFDAAWYLAQYPEARLSDVDPFTHYIRLGTAQERDPNPLFSTAWYLRRYPDVQAANANALVHFVEYGLSEGRDPHPLVTYEQYARTYPKKAAVPA